MLLNESPFPMNQPLISIIVPVYNREQYLRQCLDSLLSQTFENWECIVWDDGSTDDSRIVLEEYVDGRIRKNGTTQNHGIAQTLSHAIGFSYAPYIGILDSDDWLEPTCLEKTIQPFLDGWEVGLVYTDYFIKEAHYQNPVFNSHNMLFPGNCPFHFRLWSRSAYEDTEEIDLSLDAAVDYDLMLKLSEVTSFTRIPEPLYHYRIHDGQISKTHKDIQLVCAKRAAQNAIARRGLDDRLETYLAWNIRTKS
jgi:glycosyltransferase involved in cell wall biosynthesis